MSLTIPDGFRLAEIPGGFIGANGPLYRADSDGRLQLGFRVEERHANPVGMCHGGMLLTLADMQLGWGLTLQGGLNRFLPTINLTADFISPAMVGEWVEGQTELHRVTRRLAFGSCLLTSDDGRLVLRASGILKVPSDSPSIR